MTNSPFITTIYRERKGKKIVRDDNNRFELFQYCSCCLFQIINPNSFYSTIDYEYTFFPQIV